MFGNSKSAKSARVKQQLRDKNGRWIEMGGLVKFTRGHDTFTGEVLDADADNAPGLVKLNVTTKNHSMFGKAINVDPQYLEAVAQKADLDAPQEEKAPLYDVVAPSAQKSELDSYMANAKKNAAKAIEDVKKYGENGITSKYTVKNTAFKNFPGYTRSEELALRSYAYDFQDINGPLRTRTQEQLDRWKEYSMDYQGLTSVLDKSALAEPTTVYRGLFADKNVLNQLTKNGVYYDKAFTSTSSKKTVAVNRLGDYKHPDKTNVILEINLPAGFKAHKFDYNLNGGDGIAMFSAEEEVLLPPEVPFRVTNVTENDKGGYNVTMEPILTKANSVGVEVDEGAAVEATEKAQEVPVKKKWWQLSMSAEELSIHTRLVSDNGIIIEKVSDEIWEYKAAANKISYNNRSIDCLKSIDSITFSVESD